MKFFSIVSAFLILFQSFNISLGELAQLDEFLEHASFHKEQYGDSLLVFISKHYGELKGEHEKNHQEEQKEHENLPFQNHSCTHHLVNAFVIVTNFLPDEKIEVSTEKAENFYYLQSDSSGFASGIFQPPRHI
ncbi:hypothetical protein ACA086_03015 [Muriicola sp. E247]|uniref:hypothetical protein n=1 Tax=Muriicola sp. E247 TaxID=3242730 RepID=UPI00352382AF